MCIRNSHIKVLIQNCECMRFNFWMLTNILAAYIMYTSHFCQHFYILFWSIYIWNSFNYIIRLILCKAILSVFVNHIYIYCTVHESMHLSNHPGCYNWNELYRKWLQKIHPNFLYIQAFIIAGNLHDGMWFDLSFFV